LLDESPTSRPPQAGQQRIVVMVGNTRFTAAGFVPAEGRDERRNLIKDTHFPCSHNAMTSTADVVCRVTAVLPQT
jgi:hypothetical protein